MLMFVFRSFLLEVACTKKTPSGLLGHGGCFKNEASLPRFEIWYKKNRFIADFPYGQEKNL